MEKTIQRRPLQETTEAMSSLHPVLQRIYQARHIDTLSELERGLVGLIPFERMLNIDIAVQYLAKAVINGQSIVVVGDFDTDGATSAALAVLALRSLGAKTVNFIVPNRFIYGYGLTPEIVEVASEFKPDVLVTVDNGISSHAGVAFAKEKGMTVIITDHHLPSDHLPLADAIVDPNQPLDQFDSKNLCGVGVIFYVMLALRAWLRQHEWFAQSGIPEPNMAQFLDLVALGTVADVVPLDRNNRILVHQGLLRIRSGQCRPGIRALLDVANRQTQKVIAADLGFVVAPRLNAAGRIEDMRIGIECLICDDLGQARSLAVQLDQLNRERRTIEDTMQKQAFEFLSRQELKQEKHPFGICLFDQEWHQGVIGILAGRVKDRLHRPVIVFAAVSETELKGSARSIPGVHIRDVLDAIAKKHPEIVNKFGGHAMAAGLTLQRQHFEQFSALFDGEVRQHVTEDQLKGVIYSDGELSVHDLSLNLATLLREAGPWGQAFPEPLFDNIFKIYTQQIVGSKHLKLSLSLREDNKVFDGIAFNVDLEKWPNHRCEYIKAAYRLDVNEYNGRQRLQIMIEHLEQAN